MLHVVIIGLSTNDNATNSNRSAIHGLGGNRLPGDLRHLIGLRVGMMAITYTSDRAITNIPGATYEALRARFRALAAVVDAVGAERAALHRELKRREREASIEARLSALSEDGRAAARAVLG